MRPLKNVDQVTSHQGTRLNHDLATQIAPSPQECYLDHFIVYTDSRVIYLSFIVNTFFHLLLLK